MVKIPRTLGKIGGCGLIVGVRGHTYAGGLTRAAGQSRHSWTIHQGAVPRGFGLEGRGLKREGVREVLGWREGMREVGERRPHPAQHSPVPLRKPRALENNGVRVGSKGEGRGGGLLERGETREEGWAPTLNPGRGYMVQEGCSDEPP